MSVEKCKKICRKSRRGRCQHLPLIKAKDGSFCRSKKNESVCIRTVKEPTTVIVRNKILWNNLSHVQPVLFYFDLFIFIFIFKGNWHPVGCMYFPQTTRGRQSSGRATRCYFNGVSQSVSATSQRAPKPRTTHLKGRADHYFGLFFPAKTFNFTFSKLQQTISLK